MVLVKVFRITSVNDPETGQPGKQIELVEVRPRTQSFDVREETQLIKSIMSQLQSFGILPIRGDLSIPKMTLFLTEREYEMLGIRFEVNDVYNLTIKDGSFKFEKPEGV